jgi:hypothetical protein
VSAVVPTDSAESVLWDLRPRLPVDHVAFVGTTNWLGDEKHDGSELVVGPGDSQLDILRLARSDACNYDRDTEDLIKVLSDYHSRLGIDIFHAETDTIEFELLTLPEDVLALARELYDFCPDVVDQGVGSVEALAEAIEVTGRVYLWWD